MVSNFAVVGFDPDPLIVSGFGCGFIPWLGPVARLSGFSGTRTVPIFLTHKHMRLFNICI